LGGNAGDGGFFFSLDPYTFFPYTAFPFEYNILAAFGFWHLNNGWPFLFTRVLEPGGWAGIFSFSADMPEMRFGGNIWERLEL